MFRTWTSFLFGLLLVTTPCMAETRVALVIGNSGYERVARLGNPANDARLMADMLEAAGFNDVDLRRDLKIADMRRALRDFIEKSRDADVSVVYYAGHGIELDGVNYLIPVDAVLDRDTDIYDEALSLDRVLVAVEPAKKLRLIILDACRDSPFLRSMKRTLAARGIGRGLAKVEPTNPNTLIAFASKAGSTASDGDGKNSPFTAALVEYLPKPGLDLRRAFGFVRDDVLKNTANKQEPYVYGSLGGEDFPLVPAKPTVAPGPRADPQAAIRRDYELALQLDTHDGWEAFLRTYPEGFYADLAKGQLNKAEEARAAAAEEARLAEQERARLAAERAELEKTTSAEQARLAAEKAEAERRRQLAAVSPTGKPEEAAIDLRRALQAELRRVGCNTGSVDGNWNAASERSLDLFNKHAGMQLDVKTANTDALDAVKSKKDRVCPLICEVGYRADGDQCIKIVCPPSYVLGDDNTCEKREPRGAAKRRQEAPARANETTTSGGTMARADAAYQAGTYQSCMGARSGCYARTIRKRSPEQARIWCSRRPTC